MQSHRTVLAVLAAATAIGFALPTARADATTSLGADDKSFVCLHHPADPEVCAPTWMHTCWCYVGGSGE